MNATIAAESYKLRTVRSTYFTLGFVLLAVALGALGTAVLTNDFASATAEQRTHFSDADMSSLVLPFVQFAIATLATLAVTTEYGTGLIRTSLLAVPLRRRLFVGKIVVVGGAATAVGLVATFGLAAITWSLTADQPAPLRPWDSFGDAVPMALATTVTTAVVALVALGLGTALRSTAAGLVASLGLLFVIPFASGFLPPDLRDWVLSVSLLGLPEQLVGAYTPEPTLTPVGAVVTLAVYLGTTLTAGWLTLSRRDS
ncbi:ABC transporter permease [Actinophytocola sediminis]